jgi:hypothetical protein
MREIIHTNYDGRPINPDSIGNDDCFIDNLSEIIVRKGDEPFKSFFSVEWCYDGYSAIDPARSFVNAVVKVMDEYAGEGNNWPANDAIHYLLRDLGFDERHLTKADLVAFWTMFPRGVSEFLSEPYMELCCYNNPYGDVMRVINNPWFYKDPNAPERRLVEIAEVGGFRYAVDRACFIASPEVLGKELALLSYRCKEPNKVDATASEITPIIASNLQDWGLIKE